MLKDDQAFPGMLYFMSAESAHQIDQALALSSLPLMWHIKLPM
jgi:hypothetical protein